MKMVKTNRKISYPKGDHSLKWNTRENSIKLQMTCRVNSFIPPNKQEGNLFQEDASFPCETSVGIVMQVKVTVIIELQSYTYLSASKPHWTQCHFQVSMHRITLKVHQDMTNHCGRKYIRTAKALKIPSGFQRDKEGQTSKTCPAWLQKLRCHTILFTFLHLKFAILEVATT